MSNHPDYVTHTSQIFFKLSLVVGVIKTRQSWKYELVTPSSFQNIAFLRFHVCRERLRMTFFVHKMTSRLARTLQIGTDKVFCTRNPKITFKIPKNQLFLSYSTCLPKFGWGTTKPQKVSGTIGKWKFSFSVCSTQFELSLIEKWSLLLFPLTHNLTSKTVIFFKPLNPQNGNFSNHKQLII